ncbi:SF1B family DNA helicase RecD2 [Catonella massiliensis]|uniref:ATP-dependent RecD2 DNA helicase n=1 Tax=Catonella massiliensis TaxID=2799636 RepID=A0ABS1IY19_9FIRM|nr:ATP-dependent RecD-like DNA helicase [Catonella massiliensis]MBK5896795.1 ATP-dependent RecD-like DNA helicase [Catonella massiliensis]
MEKETINGFVEKVVYRNAENGYTVVNISVEGDDVVCTGYFSDITEGDQIIAEGSFVEHKQYGIQFTVTSYEIKEPETSVAMEKYLGSGIIKGVGPALSAKIVKKFGDETFNIIEREPERLAEIKGITEKKAIEIGSQFEEKKEFRNAMIFLNQYGVSNALAMKIYKEYGIKVMKIVRENPYRLADDIAGVGFKTADEIALRMGFSPESSMRMKAGISFALSMAASNGHTYLLYEDLYEESKRLLGISEVEFENDIYELTIERKIVLKEVKGERRVYNNNLYYMELTVARKLLDLNAKSENNYKVMEAKVREVEAKTGIKLGDLQRKAVYEAVESGLVIITGGPGTGKTTTINAIIKLFEMQNMEILLAAPTGRAAKRMTETTGMEAQTIHRLLELNGNPEEGGSMRFERNELNPLEADVIIIDEMSMVDIYLMYSLLKAITVGTRLILVGDVNQLPSVGPGKVLKDIISSEKFNVVRLSEIFRQAAESDIITNAHKINAGQSIRLDNKSKDFFMLSMSSSIQIQRALVSLIAEKLPPYVDATKYDIQVLTPSRKGELGVENLNKILQQYINPPAPGKREKQWGEVIFRENDKVMQIKNDYQMEWKIVTKKGLTIKEGSGVFNGDCGIIREINEFAGTVTVEFDEGKLVEYTGATLEELELAYAITIHKSQGSEYPAVIIPLLNAPKPLLNRNLLYTAVTRARKCVTIVGSENSVNEMIQNESEMKRNSGLVDSIIEMEEADNVYI